MMYFGVFLVLIVAFLAWVALKALKQYDGERTVASLERVSELEKRLNSLQQRLETLESIESDVLLELDSSIEMPDSADSLSLKARPSPTSEPRLRE
ncbi:MAG: hypothetical protein BMS9Abin05_1915 [Rhodothermia bacterium]|nr:MAG: hypothetical protein BMS9Abin05_1915 [Rhodothermia bacterium]